MIMEPGTKRATLKMDDSMVDVAMNIKRLRKAKELTQTELAYLMEGDKSLVSRVESAKKRYSFFTIIRIADALNVEVEDLIKNCCE